MWISKESRSIISNKTSHFGYSTLRYILLFLTGETTTAVTYDKVSSNVLQNISFEPLPPRDLILGDVQFSYLLSHHHRFEEIEYDNSGGY